LEGDPMKTVRNNRFALAALPILLFLMICCGEKAPPEQGQPGPAGDAAVSNEAIPELPEGHPPLPGVPGQDTGTPIQTMPGMPPAKEAGESGPDRKLVIPDGIKDKWKSVTLQVTDKQTGSSEALEVEIGKKTPVQGSGLEVEVLVFLPSFFMGDDMITSVSNEPNNPAAKARFTEHGKTVHEGWLFLNMPEVHPFVHDRYRIVLSGYAPAR